MKGEKILDRFLWNIWLFQNVFWEITKNIVYDTEKEKVKTLLYKLYWKTDVFDLFPAELNEERVNGTLKTLFTYYDWKNEVTESNK